MALRPERPNLEGLVAQDLSDPNVALNLASPRWRLREGQASRVLGLDLTRPDLFRPFRRRKPVGVSIPVADRPLTSAFPLVLDSYVTTEYLAFHYEHGFLSGTEATGTYEHATGILTDTGDFDGYGFRGSAHDEVIILDPPIGAVPVLSRTSDNAIVLPPGALGLPGGAADSTVKYILVQGFQFAYYKGFPSGITGYSPAVLVKPRLRYEAEGGWPSELVGQRVFVNEDGRHSGPPPDSDRPSFEVKAILSLARENDAIQLSQGDLTSGDFEAWNAKAKLSYSYPERKVLDGLCVSNGRKFWLLSGGAYTLLGDLGSDDFLGAVWEGSRIDINRYLVTSPNHPPQVIHLDGSLNRGGILAPRKPDDIERLNAAGTKLEHPSWLGYAKSTGGSIPAGTVNALVRFVNLEDNVQSDFAVVILGTETTPPTVGTPPDSSLSPDIVTTGSTSLIHVYPTRNLGGGGVVNPFTAPFDGRATHVEVWRTQSNGAGYYLEKRWRIKPGEINEEFDSTNTKTGSLLVNGLTGDNATLELSDTDLTLLPILTDADQAAGGLPPICQKSLSLGGVTLCFGQGASGADLRITVEARNFFSRGFRYIRATWSGESYDEIEHEYDAGNFFSTYAFQTGDQFVVEYGGDAGESLVETVPEGVYDIQSKKDADGIFLDEVDLISIDNYVSNIRGYIRRNFTYTWPVIEDDEDVWYSRTDLFAPENFPPRVKKLSRTGDIFRNAVAVGDIGVAVMDQGVHLLYLGGAGSDLKKETIAESGAGTPWPDSVVVLENSVIWATARGVTVMTVSQQPDVNGKRAHLTTFSERVLDTWFQEALDNGYALDGGVDDRNNLVVFRRKVSDHDYQSMVFQVKSGRVSLLDNDNGLALVTTRKAESEDLDTPELYSIEPLTGAVFRVFQSEYETAHPYDGLDVSGLLAGYQVTNTSLVLTGRRAFSSYMVGDVIQFRDSQGAVTKRTILTATDNRITFEEVLNLVSFTDFRIGAVHFQVRFAPYQGADRNSVKAVHGGFARIRPVDGVQLDQALTLRLYENFSDSSAQEESLRAFNEADAGRKTEDRVLSIQGSGVALEVEIENLEPGRDFIVESLELFIRDESNRQLDLES